jgi:hypothetical protein
MIKDLVHDIVSNENHGIETKTETIKNRIKIEIEEVQYCFTPSLYDISIVNITLPNYDSDSEFQ